MKPDISKIDEALIKIEPLLDITRGGNLFSDSERQAFKTALSVLEHTKLHGLALTEEEIGKTFNCGDDFRDDNGQCLNHPDGRPRIPRHGKSIALWTHEGVYVGWATDKEVWIDNTHYIKPSESEVER